MVTIIQTIIGAVATILAALIGARFKKEPAASQVEGVPAPDRGIRLSRNAVAAIALLVIAVLCAGVWLGIVEQHKHAEMEKRAQINALTKSYAELITQGLGKKPYVIPSVLMLVTLEQSSDPQSIISDRRTFYFLQAIEDIKSDQRSFQEEYHSAYPIAQIPGSDLEVITEGFESTKVGYDVQFDVLKGERHTVLTGAQAVVPFESPRHVQVHMFSVGGHDDAYCYPNDQADVIEELVIVVQSESLELSLPGDPDQDAARQNGSNVQHFGPQVYITKRSASKHASIVARFKNIVPNEVVGVHVQWGKAT